MSIEPEDDADRAARIVEQVNGAVIREARRQASRIQTDNPAGECLYCGDPGTGTARRWCDAACRDDYFRLEENR